MGDEDREEAAFVMRVGTPETLNPAAALARVDEAIQSAARRAADKGVMPPPGERFDWLTLGQTPERPAGTGFKRVRPTSVLSAIPRKNRRAEVVCSTEGPRPRVVAIVYPAAVPVDRCEVETEHGTPCPVGSDFVVMCACGATHRVDGARLRSALMALQARSGRVPTLDVADL